MTFPAVGRTHLAGVLLHPTSLPGPFLIGDLGPAAEAWVDWLSAAGCRLWQMLPIGPTGVGHSPYRSPSAMSGSRLLISLEGLVEDGLLKASELDAVRQPSGDRVDYEGASALRQPLLTLALDRLASGARPDLVDQAAEYAEAHSGWLDDYALYVVLKRLHAGRPWFEWPVEHARRHRQDLELVLHAEHSAVVAEKRLQFLFDRQWRKLRQRANASGIELMGDVPIFVAHDSCDVWAHPELFKLDVAGRPSVVAGVPPDFFASTGQRWGNPVYRWPAHRASGYAWWIERFKMSLERFDRIRLDHFRGFESAWEIPAGDPTAEHGRWVPGPGEELFRTAESALGRLPLVAEDLGVITPDVETLRRRLGYPGMRVVQFAFDGNRDHPYLPANSPPECAVYTGTHDNQTTRGWFDQAPESVRQACMAYLGTDATHIAWKLVAAAWASAADTVVAPIQDLLELGDEARMNTPGTDEGNWLWRLAPQQLSHELAGRVRELTLANGR